MQEVALNWFYTNDTMVEHVVVPLLTPPLLLLALSSLVPLAVVVLYWVGRCPSDGWMLDLKLSSECVARSLPHQRREITLEDE